MRDNIAKFINNAATQIGVEASNDGLNEYGFYYEKRYYSNESQIGFVFHEDGSATVFSSSPDGYTPGNKIEGFTYSGQMATDSGGSKMFFGSDGKTMTLGGANYEIID